MSRISRRLEKDLPPLEDKPIMGDRHSLVADTICHAVARMAQDLRVRAIVPCTTSGSTARLIARYRPRVPIYAVSPKTDTINRLTLSWGVHPLHVKPYRDSDEMVRETTAALRRRKLVKQGDRIILVAGLPVRVAGITNFIQVVTVE
jgi:pyruvate kinase